MSYVDPKALFRDKENFAEFVDTFGFGVGHVFFMTVTFKDNADKMKCAKAFNVFRTYLNKPLVRKAHGLSDDALHYISVWEQHKNGGWHLHLIGHIKDVSTSRIRSVIRTFLRITSTVVGFIQVKWTTGHDGNGIKYYIFKYLSKGNRKKGIRYVNYSRNWMRRVKMPFAWLNGNAGAWRNACKELYSNFPASFKLFYHNCSHRLRSAVLTSWLKGEYESAVLALKSYDFRGFKLAFQQDLGNLLKYYDAVGGFVFTDEDKAVKAFIDYAPVEIERNFSGYDLMDWEDVACRN